MPFLASAEDGTSGARGSALGGLRGLVALGLVGLLLAQLPLVLAWCCGPRDLAGLGTFWFINDFAQYEAAMDQGARGVGWLIYDRFTPEPHQPALIFSLYVGLGKLAALAGVSTGLVYRAAELAARAALIWSLAAFVVWLFGPGPRAVLAFALGLFGMGLGLLIAIGGSLLGLAELYAGNGSYEVNTFGLLFSAPHTALAMALTLVLPVAYHTFLVRPRLSLALALGSIGVGLGLLHPFHLPALFVGLGLYGALRGRSGQPPGRLALALGLPLLASAPPALYAAWTFNLDPFWGATYGAQNLLPSPRPWELPVDYGVALALAVPGVLVVLRQPSPRTRWLLLWGAVLLLAMYLPMPYQRRLSFGLQPVLAALAAVGLIEAETWLRRTSLDRLARWLRPVTLVLAFSTTAVAWLGITASALGDQPMHPYRAAAADAEAAVWLAGRMEASQVVLASWETSNYLAGQMPGRVIGGHPVATLQAGERQVELSTFFSAVDAERRRMVENYGVDYVFYGRRERALGQLGATPWLQAVYKRPGVTIYAVAEGR